MLEAIVLDPLTESSANAPLWLQTRNPWNGIAVSADGGHQYPTPDDDDVWVSSPETEGELRANTRRQRRTITVTLQVVEPDDLAGTNKATNPSAAVDTIGWTNSGLPVMERKTTLPARLDGFDTAIHAISNADSDAACLSAAVTDGIAETFSAWVYAVSGVVRLEVWTPLPANFAASADVPTGQWRRVVLPYAPDASATWQFRVTQNGAGTSEFYATGMQVGPADPYIDGDVPGCYWTGTRHASTSVRRTTGGPRYTGIRADLEAKIDKLNRQGGTYRRTVPTGETITFDVQKARLVSWKEDPVAELRGAIKAELEFTCRPLGRGAEVTV